MTNEHEPRRRVSVAGIDEGVSYAVQTAMAGAGLLDRVTRDTRVAIKPNLTYPFHRPGVTTSPSAIREVTRVLREYTKHIAVVETDGGYGAWQASEAFSGHGVYALRDEYGVEVVNLNDESRELIEFRSGRRTCQLPLPTRLLQETDLFITMPVPKVHSLTGLSLAYKNQWGCIPDVMRLRRHYVFDDAIVAINHALKPAVVADGAFFLDRSGPMEGDVVPMNIVIAATDAGAFDCYTTELMGFPWQHVPHLRRAVKIGDMPSSVEEIECNLHPSDVSQRVFRLERTLRNYLALCAFRSRPATWLAYESWFGRVVLHAILYAIAGRPVRPQAPVNHNTLETDGR
jgi:uncharacterized protein (DUF362 family)